MSTHSTFRLTVVKSGQECFFSLRCPDGSDLPPATLQYPQELATRYTDWQFFYQKHYSMRSRGVKLTGRGGSGASDAFDHSHAMRTAEETLVEQFNDWLGQRELLDIRRRLQYAIGSLSEVRLGNANSTPSRTQTQHICLQISCNDIELERLPWENWAIAPDAANDAIYISRTCISLPTLPAFLNPPRRSRLRLLAIYANAPDLDQTEDQKAIDHLRRCAKVTSFHCQLNSELPDHLTQSEDLKHRLAQTINDPSGWDILIFIGHSDESNASGGKLQLTPNIFLSITDIRNELSQACQRGLRLAIFNSCRGLHIAKALLEVGVRHVAIMREKIPDIVAHYFLTQLCQRLANREDIQTLLWKIRLDLQQSWRSYPSAHLIISYFHHPTADPFQIEPFRLRRLWELWRPTWYELAIPIGLIYLSQLSFVNTNLLNFRNFAQAVYRNYTNQIQAVEEPPVVLVSIDQQSIYRADEMIPGFEQSPMDREYLALLVNHLSALEPSAIGISYIFDLEEDQDLKQEKLAQEISVAIQQYESWFVFGTAESLELVDDIANPNQTLQGDLFVPFWYLRVPRDGTCNELCPFSYLSALAYHAPTLAEEANLLLPNVIQDDQSTFQNRVGQFMMNIEESNIPNNILDQSSPFLDWRYIIDFSVPPNQVYELYPAYQLIEASNLINTTIKNRVAIIAQGDYLEGATFPSQLSLQYWCQVENRSNQNSQKECNRDLTFGETHAYMSHHWITSHLILEVPNFLLIIFASFAFRFLIILAPKNDCKLSNMVGILTVIYGLISLQMYISLSLLMPWLMPSVNFWFLFILKYNKYSHDVG